MSESDSYHGYSAPPHVDPNQHINPPSVLDFFGNQTKAPILPLPEKDINDTSYQGDHVNYDGSVYLDDIIDHGAGHEPYDEDAHPVYHRKRHHSKMLFDALRKLKVPKSDINNLRKSIRKIHDTVRWAVKNDSKSDVLLAFLRYIGGRYEPEDDGDDMRVYGRDLDDPNDINVQIYGLDYPFDPWLDDVEVMSRDDPRFKALFSERKRRKRNIISIPIHQTFPTHLFPDLHDDDRDEDKETDIDDDYYDGDGDGDEIYSDVQEFDEFNTVPADFLHDSSLIVSLGDNDALDEGVDLSNSDFNPAASTTAMVDAQSPPDNAYDINENQDMHLYDHHDLSEIVSTSDEEERARARHISFSRKIFHRLLTDERVNSGVIGKASSNSLLVHGYNALATLPLSSIVSAVAATFALTMMMGGAITFYKYLAIRRDHYNLIFVIPTLDEYHTLLARHDAASIQFLQQTLPYPTLRSILANMTYNTPVKTKPTSPAMLKGSVPITPITGTIDDKDYIILPRSHHLITLSYQLYSYKISPADYSTQVANYIEQPHLYDKIYNYATSCLRYRFPMYVLVLSVYPLLQQVPQSMSAVSEQYKKQYEDVQDVLALSYHDLYDNDNIDHDLYTMRKETRENVRKLLDAYKGRRYPSIDQLAYDLVKDYRHFQAIPTFLAEFHQILSYYAAHPFLNHLIQEYIYDDNEGSSSPSRDFYNLTMDEQTLIFLQFQSDITYYLFSGSDITDITQSYIYYDEITNADLLESIITPNQSTGSTTATKKKKKEPVIKSIPEVVLKKSLARKTKELNEQLKQQSEAQASWVGQTMQRYPSIFYAWNSLHHSLPTVVPTPPAGVLKKINTSFVETTAGGHTAVRFTLRDVMRYISTFRHALITHALQEEMRVLNQTEAQKQNEEIAAIQTEEDESLAPLQEPQQSSDENTLETKHIAFPLFSKLPFQRLEPMNGRIARVYYQHTNIYQQYQSILFQNQLTPTTPHQPLSLPPISAAQAQHLRLQQERDSLYHGIEHKASLSPIANVFYTIGDYLCHALSPTKMGLFTSSHQMTPSLDIIADYMAAPELPRTPDTTVGGVPMYRDAALAIAPNDPHNAHQIAGDRPVYPGLLSLLHQDPETYLHSSDDLEFRFSFLPSVVSREHSKLYPTAATGKTSHLTPIPLLDVNTCIQIDDLFRDISLPQHGKPLNDYIEELTGTATFVYDNYDEIYNNPQYMSILQTQNKTSDKMGLVASTPAAGDASSSEQSVSKQSIMNINDFLNFTEHLTPVFTKQQLVDDRKQRIVAHCRQMAPVTPVRAHLLEEAHAQQLQQKQYLYGAFGCETPSLYDDVVISKPASDAPSPQYELTPSSNANQTDAPPSATQSVQQKQKGMLVSYSFKRPEQQNPFLRPTVTKPTQPLRTEGLRKQGTTTKGGIPESSQQSTGVPPDTGATTTTPPTTATGTPLPEVTEEDN